MIETSVTRNPIARKFAKSALIWLFVAAMMGVYLRWQAWGKVPMEFSFRFLTHGHSHIMFLGWVFNALIALLIRAFLPKVIPARYYQIWIILQVAIFGMAFSFPLQGYKIISIALSTLHLAFSSWLIVRLWKDCQASGPTLVAFRWAVALLFISALGPFMLAFIAANDLSFSIWYNLAVYFYLHFQYNGWMLLALLALLLAKIPLEGRSNTRAVHLFAAGTILNYSLSTLWTDPPLVLHFLALLGGGLQVAGAIVLGRNWTEEYLWPQLWKRRWSKRLAYVVVFSFALKLLLQLGVLIPGFGEMIFANRNWLVAYFHLVLIGVVSLMLLILFLENMWIPHDSSLNVAWWIFAAGFVLTEVFLVLPGNMLIPLLACAVAMAGALFWIVRQTVYAPEKDFVY